LDFGSVIMRPGRAYSTRDANPQVGLAGHGNEPGSIPVGKAWLDAGLNRVYFFMHENTEVFSPVLAKYAVEQFNKHCDARLAEPVFVE